MKNYILKIADHTAPSTEAHRTFGLFSILLWLFVVVLYIVSVAILTTTYKEQVAEHIPLYSTFATFVLACVLVGIGLLSIHLLFYSWSWFLNFQIKYKVACFLAAILFYGGSMTAVYFAVHKQVKAVSNKVEIESVTAKFDNKILQIENDADTNKQNLKVDIKSLQKRTKNVWLNADNDKMLMIKYKQLFAIDSTAKADVQSLQVQKAYECNTLQMQADNNAAKTGYFAFVLIMLDLFCNFSLVWLQSMFRKRETVYTLKNGDNTPKEPIQQTNVLSLSNTTNIQNNTLINVNLNIVEKTAYNKDKDFINWLLTQPIEKIESFKDVRGASNGAENLRKALQGTNIQYPENKSLCLKIALKQLTTH